MRSAALPSALAEDNTLGVQGLREPFLSIGEQPVDMLKPAMTFEDVRVVRRFRAMNTDIELYVREAARAPMLAEVEAYFHAFERRFSRFVPDSELSLFNARPDDLPCAVSPEFAAMLREAIALHRVTRGIFEPAMLPQIEAAGYARSFERIERNAAAPAMHPARRSIAEMRIDADGSVHAPAGLRIDLGGMGKGWAVDAAVRLLAPADDVLVNAGGDMYASGRSEWDEGWYAAVADPRAPERNISVMWLRDQALATSTTVVRRWQRGAATMHHIIDPRTGAPARTDVLSASVVATRTVDADVFAKTALILGSRDGSAFLERQGTPGLLMLEDGSVVTTSGWPGQPPD